VSWRIAGIGRRFLGVLRQDRTASLVGLGLLGVERGLEHRALPALSAAITIQGVGVASGRAGWTGTAHGQAHLDKGSMQRAGVEVASTIAERFQGKVSQAEQPGK
jgi:hypothetical protein